MFLLQNVYTSKESTSYIVSSKLLQTLEAAIKERDDAVEDANNYSIGSIPFMFMSCIFFPAFAKHCIRDSQKPSCYLLQSRYTEIIEK